jgi:Lar family restriction alleviation protein
VSNYYSAGIKECPFCGGDGKLVLVEEYGLRHYVKCESCGASRDHIYAENDEQAIDIWNSRNGEDIETILKKQKWLFDKE